MDKKKFEEMMSIHKGYGIITLWDTGLETYEVVRDFELCHIKKITFVRSEVEEQHAVWERIQNPAFTRAWKCTHCGKIEFQNSIRECPRCHAIMDTDVEINPDSESIDPSECKPVSPTNTPLFRAYTAMYDTGWQTYHLALTLNEEKTNTQLQSFVDWWTRGDSFIPRLFGPVDLDAPPKREADTDAELNACLKRIHDALQAIICEGWTVGLSREVCLLLCNSMLLPTGLGADFRLLPDLSLTAHDIAGLWSKTHPDEQKISYSPDFAI